MLAHKYLANGYMFDRNVEMDAGFQEKQEMPRKICLYDLADSSE